MLPRIKKQFTILNSQKKTIALLVIFFVALVFLFAKLDFVAAQTFTESATSSDTYGLQQLDQNVLLSNQDLRVIIAKIIRAFLGLLGTVALVLVLYAGYTIMTSGGNEEKMTQGKKILQNAVIGLTIILSAFIIVSFVINALSNATGYEQRGAVVSRPPTINTFAGSGALGRVIKDHYPARDQKDVARNTSIIVTLALPTDPASFIINSNNTCWNTDHTAPTTTCVIDAGKIVNPYYGDCLKPAKDFDFARDCDHLNTSSVKIYQRDDKNKATVETAVMASYEKDGQAYNYVFKPFEYIGSDKDDVWYEVYLTNKILKEKIGNDVQQGIFDGQFNNYYSWRFQTNTTLDLTPPTITGVFPASRNARSMEPRNVIVQVYFSEAVDPTVTQGVLSASSLFNNLIFATTSIKGEWKLSSGYQVAEFISDEPCGQNSCGETMFCLPVFCGRAGCQQPYTTLARTAELLDKTKKDNWQAIPFTGVYDAYFNALNGNDNNVAEGKNIVGFGDSGKSISSDDRSGNNDNYYWDYIIENRIDRTPPYIQAIDPQIDAENVDDFVLFNINFNTKMWVRSLRDNIVVEEYPAEYKYPTGEQLPPFWFTVYAGGRESSGNTALITHRNFGPNGTDLYYFPIVSSSLRNAYQNCFYPGYGPVVAGTDCAIDFETSGKIVNKTGCVNVSVSNNADTGCVQLTNNNEPYGLSQSDTKTCLEKVMKDKNISPTTPPPIQ